MGSSALALAYVANGRFDAFVQNAVPPLISLEMDLAPEPAR